MCTAVSFDNGHFYFGRTLDYDKSLGEKVVITPRNFAFSFRHEGRVDSHFAMIGTAVVNQGYPLYFDAMNEKGLCMAGLNFVGNAVYSDVPNGRYNLAQFEFIPWVLGLFSSVAEVKKHLKDVALLSENFSADMPAAELHWLIADGKECIVAEFVKGGLKVYDNPVGVLTNNPPFDMQLFNLNNYVNLSPYSPVPRFAEGVELAEYGRGMGALGLPGDMSPMSRFVRAAFVKLNYICEKGGTASVNDFFHILESVCVPSGSVRLSDGVDITRYACCMDAEDGIYYYTTYSNRRIEAVSMRAARLDGNALIVFEMPVSEDILYRN